MKSKLDYYRKAIDKTDKAIINLLYQRSKFKLNDSLNVQDPFLRGFYSEFLKGMCAEGNDKYGRKTSSLDSKMSGLLMKRIDYGEPIAKYKELHNLAIENKEREKQVLDKLVEYSRTIGFEKIEAIEKAYQFIMDRTKDLQNCVLSQLRIIESAFKSSPAYTTASKDAVSVLKAQAESEIENRHGKYVAKVTEEDRQGGKIFSVRVVPDV